MSHAPTGKHAKAYGAFYTDEIVADFLVRWAVRSPNDRVLDPSFGGGVFLETAAIHLSELGGDHKAQVFGVELDIDVHERVSIELAKACRLRTVNLLRSDFFDVDPLRFTPLDAVVGNPPFIRYQSFSGEARKKAALRAFESGVTLSKLASSWAAFVVHSTAFLKPGGRLGMVIPIELGHATYAQPVLTHLSQAYRRVTLLTFKECLFPDLSQDTLLLLAEDKNAPFEGFFWRDIEYVTELEHLHTGVEPTERLPEVPLLNGHEKLIMRFIPDAARALYGELGKHRSVSRLGSLADVGIGYVTGANGFFHLSPELALNLPAEHLKPAVFRGAAFSGLSFSEADWRGATQKGRAGYLLHITDDSISPSLRAHLAAGETRGVHHTYKCRIRTPWYGVPHVYTPDAFLTYMSGLRPQLVANTARAVAPNTLHVVRFRPYTNVSSEVLAAFWQTSLTSLSVELEGHALGGGMLKLEPGEARRLLIATPEGDFSKLIKELDTLLRQGKPDEAQDLADVVILQNALGLNRKTCELLKESARVLRHRRYYKGKRN